MADESSTAPGRNKPLPQCKAFLLCEDVYQHELTGQFILHKVIHEFRFATFPGNSESFYIYLQFYDGIGRYEVSIQLYDPSDGRSMAAAMVANLEFTERFAKMDLVVPINSLRLPRPGRYEILVLLNGQELETQFVDAEIENGQEKD